MGELFYIIVGWVLGLFSPIFASRIKEHHEGSKFKKALAGELADLKYRLCGTSFILRRRQGTADIEYLRWLKAKVEEYRGEEPDNVIKMFIDKLLALNEAEFEEIVLFLKESDRSIGISLKTHAVSYFESNVDRIADLGSDLQTCCHEFRNHLSILNQEICRAVEMHSMTFDSSLSSINHERLVNDIEHRHEVIEGMCRIVVEKIDSVQGKLGGTVQRTDGHSRVGLF